MTAVMNGVGPRWRSQTNPPASICSSPAMTLVTPPRPRGGNARKTRLLASTTLSGQDWPDRVLTLPLVQITLAREAEADRILTLSPIGLNDYFTSLTMEHAQDQPIAEPTLEKIARALRIKLTETLRHDIYCTIIGTTLMTVRKWYGPRTLLALLKDLKRDSLGTISRSKGDTFAEFVIQTIQDQASATKMPARDVIKKHIEAMQEVVPRGRPDEEVRTIFFEAIVAIAHRQGDTWRCRRAMIVAVI
jgi:hypothetical protein